MGATQSYEVSEIGEIPLTEEEINRVDNEPQNEQPVSMEMSYQDDIEIDYKEKQRKAWDYKEKQRKIHKQKKRTTRGPQCKSTTRKGKKCKKIGKPYCEDHAPKTMCLREKEFNIEKYLKRIIQFPKNIGTKLNCS